MYSLQTPVGEIRFLGKKIEPLLKKLSLYNIGDLLWHIPSRYEDFSRVTPIALTHKGDSFCIRGSIHNLRLRRIPFRRMILVEGVVRDQSGEIKVVWFHQPLLLRILKEGDILFLVGKVEGTSKIPLLSNPLYEIISNKKVKDGTIHTGRIVPFYPLTKNLSHKQVRAVVAHVFLHLSDIPEIHPAPLLKDEDLVSRKIAFKEIHFPSSFGNLEKARERLIFDELFFFHQKVQKIKRDFEETESLKITFFESETRKFVSSLPFSLTSDQKKGAWEMLREMQTGKTMNRLLNGDVGSGKTVVVGIVALNVALSGYASAILAPTEILALQHFETFSQWFKDFPIIIGLCTQGKKILYGKNVHKKDISQSEMLEALHRNEIHILIGTHAILSDQFKFPRLALAVVDEQHRFGVKQRSLLRREKNKKEYVPHFLSLSATPIPRTLFLAFFGDLKVSTLRTLPNFRKPVQTFLFSEKERMKAYEIIIAELRKGNQAFVLCPRVNEENDILGIRSVEAEFARLQKESYFQDFRFGKLHGKMASQEKENVMAAFRRGELDILICSSVVEVGVDIPNATVMLIESPERFGLSQLHQLRGRVGRSEKESFCLLIGDSENMKKDSRIKIFSETFDGFVLAQNDLLARGFGDLEGTEQSGDIFLWKIASLKDYEISLRAKEWVKKLS